MRGLLLLPSRGAALLRKFICARRERPGRLCRDVLVEERQVYHLAEHISFREGALIEPTACAVHGIDVIRPRAGDDVLQFGAGPTGLILAQLLRHNGAACLLAADLSPVKLELAARYAGAEPVQVRRDDPRAHIAEIEAKFPRGFDIVVDATGVSRVAESLPRFAKYGAKVVFYGVCPEDEHIQISPYEIFRRELTVLGSFSQAHTFARATHLVNAGVVKVKELVSHTFPLEGWGEALAMVTEGAEQVKIVIEP